MASISALTFLMSEKRGGKRERRERERERKEIWRHGG
jgi:hypothetical protein